MHQSLSDYFIIAFIPRNLDHLAKHIFTKSFLSCKLYLEMLSQLLLSNSPCSMLVHNVENDSTDIPNECQSFPIAVAREEFELMYYTACIFNERIHGLEKVHRFAIMEETEFSAENFSK